MPDLGGHVELEDGGVNCRGSVTLRGQLGRLESEIVGGVEFELDLAGGGVGFGRPDWSIGLRLRLEF